MDKRENTNRRNHIWIYGLILAAGGIFCLYYLNRAFYDVVYSDYIRLVNSYLPDVWNPDKFFVADVLTRIPVNYLARIINTTAFGYSVTFDQVLGVLSLGAAGAVFAAYCIRRGVGAVWFLFLMSIMFCLNKWEMLINGSGWAHFLAFACFYYHYLVLDRVWSGQEKPHDRWKLLVLPLFITVGVAGPYCAVYIAVLLLAYGFLALVHHQRTGGWDKRYAAYGLAALLSLFLYLWSSACTVEDYTGATDVPLLRQLLDTPGFFIRFFVKSFSSMVIGGERAEIIFSSNLPYYVLGTLVIASYLLALWLNLRYRLYEKTVFPLLLIAAGGLNHVLILLSRWIFLKENYGISSRYALQFQVGVLGIILTFALMWKQLASSRERLVRLAAAGFCIMFLAGGLYTTYHELQKAPYRKQRCIERAEIARNFESKTDDELRAEFEYKSTKPGSGALVRDALTILKSHNWNVFRE